jgi:hypothetical protein
MKAQRASKQKPTPEACGRDLAVWIEIVREARLLHGEAVARAIWAKSPLPKAKKAKSRDRQTTIIELFLSDRCELRKGLRVRADQLFETYRQWCARTNRAPVLKASFGRLLSAQGIARRKTNSTTVYLDVGLREIVPARSREEYSA